MSESPSVRAAARPVDSNDRRGKWTPELRAAVVSIAREVAAEFPSLDADWPNAAADAAAEEYGGMSMANIDVSAEPFRSCVVGFLERHANDGVAHFEKLNEYGPIAIDESRSPEERDRAWARIDASLKWAQRRAVGRFRCAELEDSAAAHVYTQWREDKLKYKPDQARFGQFVIGVFKNRWRKEARRRRKWQGFAADPETDKSVESELPDRNVPSSFAELHRIMEIEDTLPQADLDEIRKWPNEATCVVLIRCRLFVNLPLDMQKEILGKERGYEGDGLDELQNVVSLTIYDCAKHDNKERTATLNLLLLLILPHQTLDGIRQIFARNKHRLFDLPIFHQLFEYPAESVAFFDWFFGEARLHFCCGTQTDDAIPFDDDDLRLLQHLKRWGCHRLDTLPMSGLWQRVPADVWQAWCESKGKPAAYPRNGSPFPFEGSDDQRARHLIGDISERHVNARLKRLLTVWCRKRHKLLSLPSHSAFLRRRRK